MRWDGFTIAFNPVKYMVICLDESCGYKVTQIDDSACAERITKHLGKCHKVQLSDQNRKGLRETIVNWLNADRTRFPDNDLDEPVEGLTIMKGFKCKFDGCDHCGVKESSKLLDMKSSFPRYINVNIHRSYYPYFKCA
jgi:hypothetical protein